MAGIAPDFGGGGIPAGRQFSAIAWLRWRLFVNSFRRKGAKGELLARIIMVPVLALLVVGPILGGGAAAYYAISGGHPDLMSIIFWAIFALQIIVSINIAPPALSFDPEQLVRFPLSFPRYLAIRIFLGLLATSTVIGTLALLAAAAGATIARPALAIEMFAVTLALAVTNMLFIRMVFAWVDRWLSTRRAREIFTGLIILISVGFQYINVTFNPGFGGSSDAKRAAKAAVLKHAYHVASPLLRVLPPGFAAASVSSKLHGHIVAASWNIAGVLIFAALFLSVFAWRMKREFRGENLSDGTASPADQLVHATPALTAGEPVLLTALSPVRPEPSLRRSGYGKVLRVAPAVTACVAKEWIYLRRNTAQFYAILGPLAMVLLFSSRMGRFSHSGYSFPAAVAYSVLGICALSYNIFGVDAAGVQFYFLAPVNLRSVVVAKNLFGFAVLTLEVGLLYIVISMGNGRPSGLIAASTFAWALLAGLINATVGNIRSITAPKKMDPGKFSRQQASQMSALLAVGLMLLSAAVGAGLILLGRRTSLPWLPLPVLLGLAGVAFAFYLAGLGHTDNLIRRHRETMLEELSKTA